MVPMVVTDKEKVNFGRHVVGFVNISPRKGSIDKRHWRAFIKHRVSQNDFAIQTEHERAVSEPNVEVTFGWQQVQVGFNNTDFARLRNPVLRLRSEEEPSHNAKHAALVRGQNGFFFVAKPFVHEMLRLEDTLETLALGHSTELLDYRRFGHFIYCFREVRDYFFTNPTVR